jgi:DNA polymerase-3 subunit beta
MEFTVKRNSLFSELNLVQGVIEKKSTIPILANILLEAHENRLGITATDLDVSICCGCEAEVHSVGTSTISARRLFEIVRFLPEDSDLQFTLMENDWMELRSGNSEYKVVGLPKENFPTIPEPVGSIVTIPGNILRAMIQRTLFAITQEESRYALNGALLILTPQEVRMVATDGHRLAVVSKESNLTEVDSEIRALIPRKTLLEIQKLISDQDLLVEFGRDENHIFFSVGGKRLVSRILAGQFPNYELVVPRDNDKSIIASTRMLGDGVRRTAVMADEKLKAIKMFFNPGSVELTASSSEAGEAREVVPIQFEGPSVAISFNPQYLIDFFGACGSDTVNILIKDEDTQGLFRPGGSAELDYRYVVMPMKF